MDCRINYNFSKVYDELLKTHKRTAIAHGMGYSTTTQLENNLTGISLISTKAVLCLVKNFNINPTFIFTGIGGMFLIKKPKTYFTCSTVTF